MIVVLLDVGTLHRVGILALLVENYGHGKHLCIFKRKFVSGSLRGWITKMFEFVKWFRISLGPLLLSWRLERNMWGELPWTTHRVIHRLRWIGSLFGRFFRQTLWLLMSLCQVTRRRPASPQKSAEKTQKQDSATWSSLCFENTICKYTSCSIGWILPPIWEFYNLTQPKGFWTKSTNLAQGLQHWSCISMIFYVFFCDPPNWSHFYQEFLAGPAPEAIRLGDLVHLGDELLKRNTSLIWI